MDLALKWRLFRSLHGGSDSGAERIYRWHIEKRSGQRMQAGLPTDQWKRELDDYVNASKQLYASMMRSGFNPAYPVPIDPCGELLDGSHRVACAFAIGIEDIPVEHKPQFVWAPDWGLDWFIKNNMDEDDLARLKADWEAMNA